MVGSGFRVDGVLKILLYRKCSKYNLGRAAITRGLACNLLITLFFGGGCSYCHSSLEV